MSMIISLHLSLYDLTSSSPSDEVVAEAVAEAACAPVQGLPKEDQRQLLLSVPFTHMSNILQALPGQACIDALLSIGAPLCKDLLLSMPAAASKKLLHAASLTDLAKLIKVTFPSSSPQVVYLAT